MSLFRTAICKAIDNIAPPMADAYRWWRKEKLVIGPASPTPYRFKLVGPRFLTKDDFETTGAHRNLRALSAPRLFHWLST